MSIFNLFRPKVELVFDAQGKIVAISPAELKDILKTQQNVTPECWIKRDDNEFYLVTERCMHKFIRWAKVHKIPQIPYPPIKNSRGQFIKRDCDDYRGILYGKIKEYLYPDLAAGMDEGQGTMKKNGIWENHAWDWFVNENKKLRWIDATRDKNWIYDPDFNRPVYFVMT